MLKGYQIVDADSHVIEPLEMWEQYLEPAFKQFAPYNNTKIINEDILVQAGTKKISEPSLKDLKIAGEPICYKLSDSVLEEAGKQAIHNFLHYAVRDFNPESQVKAMQKLGTDISFLYPTMGLWVLAINKIEPQLAGALTRAYNNWLRDFCSYEPQLLRGVGAINQHDPIEMISELHRIADFGWKAVYLRPNPVKERLLSHPDYELFWTECEKLNIAVAIHEGTHSQLPTTGSDRFNTRFAMHACSHPMEQMMALLALIEGGVLERHPQLKVALLETGCGWLPYWLWRLDEEYKNLGWEVQNNIKMKPSDYFRRQCFISIEPSEPYLQQIIDFIGTDNLIFGSDYPHIDHNVNITQQVVALEERLPKKTLQKILWDNPRRFYGLD
ncbi:MAG TPA: amidohydrolase family protein [Nostocaceae cyanobacterium]|nr:amidohydrolase family protein [Nostocaceae cyanobacterium]